MIGLRYQVNTEVIGRQLKVKCSVKVRVEVIAKDCFAVKLMVKVMLKIRVEVTVRLNFRFQVNVRTKVSESE